MSIEWRASTRREWNRSVPHEAQVNEVDHDLVIAGYAYSSGELVATAWGPCCCAREAHDYIDQVLAPFLNEQLDSKLGPLTYRAVLDLPADFDRTL